MKTTAKLIGVLVIAGALPASHLQAQCGEHHHGAGCHMPLFDTTRVHALAAVEYALK